MHSLLDEPSCHICPEGRAVICCAPQCSVQLKEQNHKKVNQIDKGNGTVVELMIL